MREHQPPTEEVSSGPTVFISYRREDTRELARRLAGELRGDLGSRNVFRDEDDLIVGEPWQAVLDQRIADSDAAIFLVGDGWRGLRHDGTSRIDDEDDPVRNEVLQALGQTHSAFPLPFLVDIADPPSDLPDEITPLFEEHHFVGVSRDGLESIPGPDYQGVLVGIWNALRRRVPRGVLILGERTAMASLDVFVDKLKDSGEIEARHLSRFASGAYIVSVRESRKLADQWSDVFVLADEGEPSDELKGRVAAILAIPGVKVTLVGAGAGALGLVMGQAIAASPNSSPAILSSGDQVVAGVGQQAGVSAGSIQHAWLGASITTKVVTLATAAAVTIGAGFAIDDFFDNDTPQFAASSRLAPADGPYPHGQPEPVTVDLGSAQTVSEEEARDYFGGFEGGSAERRSAEVTYGDHRLELGDIIVPVKYPDEFIEVNTGSFLMTSIDPGREVPFIDAGAGAMSNCVSENTGETAGGWQYTGDPGLVVLELLFTSDGTAVTDIRMDVTFDGPVEALYFPEYLEEVDSADVDDRCTPVDRLPMTWTVEVDG